MAKGTYTGDYHGALSFINSLGFDAGNIGSPKYAERIANRLEGQIARGQEPNYPAARGHSVTAEHRGREFTARPEYQLGPTRGQREQFHTPSTTREVGDGVISYGHNKRDAEFAASVGLQMDGHIKMSFTDRNGETRYLFSNGGIKAAEFKDILAKHSSWQDALAEFIELCYPNRGGEIVTAIGGEVQFYID